MNEFGPYYHLYKESFEREIAEFEKQKKEEFMSKEVAKKEKAEVAAYTAGDLAEWGDEAINASDVVIPKILIMQGLSELVAERKAQMGDFIVSGTNAKVGSMDAPISILPFHLERSWVVFKEEKGKFEFERIEKAGMDSSELPWEWEEKGVKWRRDYTYNFFVLLEKDLGSAGMIPHVLSFRRTASRTGKELYTQMWVTNRAAGLPPAGIFLTFGAKLTKNDKGTYVVPHLVPGRAATKDEVALALKWKKTFQGKEIKVDNTDLKKAESEVASTFNENQF